MPTITRRAFLKLTALAAGAAAFARLLPGRAVAAVRACLPVLGTDVPTMIPTVIGDDCAPPPTATDVPTLTATATASPTATATVTSTPSATATASPTLTPTAARWRLWLPLLRHMRKP